jgi:hypothetical protein
LNTSESIWIHSIEDHFKKDFWWVYGIFPQGLNPFKNSWNIQIGFGPKIYNMKFVGIWSWANGESCQSWSNEASCQVWRFLDFRKIELQSFMEFWNFGKNSIWAGTHPLVALRLYTAPTAVSRPRDTGAGHGLTHPPFHRCPTCTDSPCALSLCVVASSRTKLLVRPCLVPLLGSASPP